MRTSLTANVSSKSLPKLREEATRHDLSETVGGPAHAFPLPRTLRTGEKHAKQHHACLRPCVCDVVYKLSQFNMVQPMCMIEEAMQEPPGKVKSDKQNHIPSKWYLPDKSAKQLRAQATEKAR